MFLTKSLNIAIPLERADGKTIHVHSMPVGEAVFERFFMAMSKTYATIFSKGLGSIVGARTAALLLKKIATADGDWDGPEGVQAGLLAEINRLTNVIAPTASGWETIPIEQAVGLKAIEEGDRKEVENLMVFFTLASWVPLRRDVPAVLGAMASVWEAQLTSLNCTDFGASLPTSIATDSSGASPNPLSIPS